MPQPQFVSNTAIEDAALANFPLQQNEFYTFGNLENENNEDEEEKLEI
jgi:hypothetical protein